MEVTKVASYKVEGSSKIKANVHFTLDDELVLKCILVQGTNTPFLSFPNTSYESEGETVYKDLVYPITKEFREYLTDIAITDYTERFGEVSKPAKKYSKKK